MNYKDFTLGDWIGHISGVIEDGSELDGNEMRDLVEFLSGLPRWVPVSERLPEDDGDYLVTFQASKECAFWVIARYANDLTSVDHTIFSEHESGWVEFDCDEGWKRLRSVTAWMQIT